jgi:mannose-6-phosphate isomerase-like protein (cupin superfamily)
MTNALHVHTKVWGHEIWYTNTPLYCLKRLIVKAGFRCSWHCHIEKDETFVCDAGCGIIEIEPGNHWTNEKPTVFSYTIQPGMSVHIPSQAYHRFYSVNGMTLLEVSTHHSDADVMRRDTSGRIEEE